MAIDWNNLQFLQKQFERGQVVLFAGAGFSFDAKNATGDTPPLGVPLAKFLAQRAGLAYNGESLPVVFAAAQKHLGSQSLWSYLKELYEIRSYADWYKIVASITWYRIYTLNIDNLVQELYQRAPGQRLDSIICPAPPQERDPLFRRVQGVHLHGFVEQPQIGLTFTLEDFARQTGKPSPWYQTLVDDFCRQSVLFVGTLLEEAPFYHYLELRDLRDRGVHEFRPKSYLVSPHIGQIRAEALKDRNIQAIEATGEEFFTSLAEHIPLKSLGVESVRGRVYPHVIIRDNRTEMDTAVNRHFDLILPDALPPVSGGVGDYFFLGAEPTWDDIKRRRDGKRVVNAELLGILKQKHVGFRCVVLHGPAGSGKTTTLMRVACDMAAEGHGVFYAKGLDRLDLTSLIDLAQDPERAKEPIFAFLDVMARHLGSIDRVLKRFADCPNLTLVLADRSNAYYGRCQAIADLNPAEVKMPDLVEEDVLAILNSSTHKGKRVWSSPDCPCWQERPGSMVSGTSQAVPPRRPGHASQYR
ncbi:MAG TPA: SIR2 family protein, partial [Gemmataceae bacterium]|nr:SIR2 family protein [Gemmataceae bacterium]